MSTAVDRVLDQRKGRISLGQRRGVFVFSLSLHLALTALFVLWPSFFKKPPKKLDYIAVTVVPPRALGEEAPAARRQAPAKAEPKPAPPAPTPKTEPKPEPPKTPKTEPKPVIKNPEPAPPPPSKETPKSPSQTPTSPAATDALPAAVPKRQGSPFGNPLGASTQQATLGVEDPNFTYGYYLDRIVGVISANWTRPSVDPEIKQALLFFRIQRDGTIAELKLVETSGSQLFDDAALRAVQSSSPLPPLPKSYAKDSLGIHLLVK